MGFRLFNFSQGLSFIQQETVTYVFPPQSKVGLIADLYLKTAQWHSNTKHEYSIKDVVFTC